MSTSRALKVGVQLPEVERRVDWPELVTMARTAEDVGLDSLWLGDHLLYDLPGGVTRGPWEAWTSLAALAAVTERVELGPFVASTSFHAPAMLAKQATTVDAISGGRIVLGLGAGWNEREYTAFGFPFDHRVSRFEEAFTIIRELVRDGRSDFRGRYHEVVDCVLDPRPSRPGGPPLMLGSTSPRMLRIGLPHVDLWNTWWSDYGNTVDGFVALRARVEESAQAAGRAPGAVGATAAVLVQLEGGVGRTMGDGSYNLPVTPVPGDPAAISEHLHAMASAGAVHVQLVLDPITTDSIEIVGRALTVLDGA
ncbi:luciferase [Intrasporangium oryzae NRRL B-24470]|uniref:Luciferase n=1 Tax=Intrasporangium oryzae NRRL B-24470 TaxID=1386089 RepID=W9GCT2_9MICO|nr:LLM class flavin-dependent oxidoreductase [Intrasporangium oryzae]EWT03017.1 luciferase [Intrasporangium oryzae NRRL B-24470]